MAGLADYILAWNDWVVMPALLIVSIVWFIKVRKARLGLLAAGLGIYLGATVVRLLYPHPLNLVHGVSLIAQAIGFLLAVAGFSWFWSKQRPMQSNSALLSDASTSPLRAQRGAAKRGR